MTPTSKTVLFFGNERLATGVTTSAPTLRALVAAGYSVPAVVVAQQATGSSRKSRELEIEAVAREHNIPVISRDNLNEAREQLASYNAEAAVLIAYGKIVPQHVIDIFPKGIINLHPSLLPQHRGPTPLESVILEGAAETGVSIMQLSAAMDAGPVYAQQTVPLSGQEDKQVLADQLAALGSQLIIENLPAILDGSLTASPQDNSQATYDNKIDKTDGQLDFTKPAMQLEREVRAFYGWPRSRATIGGTPVIITKAQASEGSGQPGSLYTENKNLGIYCAEGLLLIESLIPAGKKEMPVAAFLAGYQI